LPPSNGIETFEEFDKYIYSFFIGSLLKTFKENKVKLTEEKDWPIELLVMWNGIVCEISSDLSFAREDRGIYALGSGQSYGLGALAAIYKEGTQKNADSAIKQAIGIASGYDTYTGLPAQVVSTKLKSEWKDK
jgi:ATP-dependent protease HslVU (ClpYQ) peptidase subunit